jgi:hypothetical protein
VAAEEYRVNGWRTEVHGAPLQPLFGEEYTPALWVAAFEQFRRDNGNFGCVPRCHTWQLGSFGDLGVRMNAEQVADREGGPCYPVTFALDLGCTGWGHDRNSAWISERDGGPEYHHWTRCLCVTMRLERAACLGCLWWGPIRSWGERHPDEDPSLDAVRHVWPDVDSKPTIRRMPHVEGNSKADQKKTAAWTAEAVALYGQDWIDDRGPIWTERDSIMGSRHVPNRTPWNGWDLARLAPDADTRPRAERYRRLDEEEADDIAAYEERKVQRALAANTVTLKGSPAYV